MAKSTEKTIPVPNDFINSSKKNSETVAMRTQRVFKSTGETTPLSATKPNIIRKGMFMILDTKKQLRNYLGIYQIETKYFLNYPIVDKIRVAFVFEIPFPIANFLTYKNGVK